LPRAVLYSQDEPLYPSSQNHLREQMEPELNSRLEWWIHLLTQVVLTSWPRVALYSRDEPLYPWSQNHLREQMEPKLNPRLEWWTHLLTQVVLPHGPEPRCIRKIGHSIHGVRTICVSRWNQSSIRVSSGGSTCSRRCF
jgi:hypothetical protein